MAQHAELVFTGGPVYSADASHRRIVAVTCSDGSPATTVAVAGGRIAAIGTAGDRDIRDLTGPATEIVDLRGRALLPGFQDAHVHPAFAGVTMLGCNLIGARTLDEALARIAGYARQHADRPWIAGSGWRMEWFPGGTPDRRTLDAVTQDRPAYLSNRDGHGAWASTRALELAGLGARTPDPADGRIEREADGTPQGTLHEGAADLVGRLVPPLTLEERVAGPAARAAAPARARRHRVAGRHRGGVPGRRRSASGVPGRRDQRAADRSGSGRALVGSRQG